MRFSQRRKASLNPALIYPTSTTPLHVGVTSKIFKEFYELSITGEVFCQCLSFCEEPVTHCTGGIVNNLRDHNTNRIEKAREVAPRDLRVPVPVSAGLFSRPERAFRGSRVPTITSAGHGVPTCSFPCPWFSRALDHVNRPGSFVRDQAVGPGGFPCTPETTLLSSLSYLAAILCQVNSRSALALAARPRAAAKSRSDQSR